MDRTLLVIKPDGVRRNLIGRIVQRFEDRGFRIVNLRMLEMQRETAEEFYSPHKDKAFYPDLIEFITSGPIVVIILEGASAVEVVRRMVGSTNSLEAPGGTVRGDLGLATTENVVHASDSIESFERESRILGLT
ncbi:MAG: nucleoside-diphosphate kinase [Nitrososphaerales archaeon]